MSAPIVIPITIADTGSATLDAVAGQFDNLARAGDKLTASMLGTEKAAQSMQDRFVAMNATFGALASGAGSLLAGGDKLAQMFVRVGEAAATAGEQIRLNGATAELAAGQYDVLGTAMGAQTGRFDAGAVAADRYTAAITRQIVAIGDLYAVNMAGGATPLGPGGPAKQAGKDAAMLSGRGLAGLGTGTGSPLSALGAAAFSPPVIASVIAGYLGYKAVNSANQYNQTIADIVAQSTQDSTTIQPLQQGVLSLAGGQNRFTPQQLEQGLYPIASSPIYAKTADQTAALNVVSQQAQSAGPGAIKSLASADVGAVSAYHMQASDTAYVADVIAKGVNIGLAESPDFAKGVGTFSAASLAADPNKNRAFEQAVGAFSQQTNLSPRFRFDAQGENAFFQVINKSLTGRSAELGKALDVQGMFGPGAEGRAGGLAAWLQQLQTKTAGPNQQGYLQGLFGRQNALQFVRGFTGDNYGSGQVSIAGTSNAAGTVAKGASIADNGPQAQWDQIGSKFNKDVIEIGTEISGTLNPALSSLATAALNAGDKIGGWLGTGGHAIDLWVANAPWNVAATTEAQHRIDQQQQKQDITSNYNALTPQQKAGISPFFTNSSNYADSVNYKPPTAQAPGAPGSGYHGYGPFLPPAPAPQPFTGFSSSYVNLAQSENQQAIEAHQAAANKLLGHQGVSAFTANAPTRDARAWLGSMELSGSSATDVNKQLVLIREALKTSTYSDAQRSDILAKETKKAGIYERGLNAPADQAAVNLAQQNDDAAKAMNETPAQLKAVFDQYLDAERKLATDTLTGKPLQKELGRINQQGAVNDYQTAQKELSRQQKDLSNAVQLATQGHNAGGANAARTALYQSEVANAGALGLDKSDLQLLHAELLAANRGPATPGPTLIRGPESGQGDALAGFNSITARLSQPGGENPLAATVRHLQGMVKLLQQQLSVEEKSGQTLAAIKDINAEQANTPPPHVPAPHHAPTQHQRSRVL